MKKMHALKTILETKYFEAIEHRHLIHFQIILAEVSEEHKNHSDADYLTAQT
jgi:hypothetical protein